MRIQFLLGALLLSAMRTMAQDPWVLPGNTGTDFTSDFLGTTDDERLTIRTYDKTRLVVNEEDVYTIGSFASMPADGFIGISPSSYFWDNGPGPFSRLHLAEPGAAGFHSGGYRPWMRNGISLTGNSDQMYVGQKYTYEEPENPESGEMDDFTDAIIQWSDNPGTWLSDRMRFIFTSVYNSDPTGNGSMEGLEALQLFPDDSGSEVLVGIGDWYAAGVNPDERLDVLDRTIMIRQLPTHYEDINLDYEKVVVSDDDGRLHWRPLSSFPVATDACEWSMSTTSPNHVYTAYGAASATCPDDLENVGIGVNAPVAKLDIRRNPTSSHDTGVQIYTYGDNNGAFNTGLSSNVMPLPGGTLPSTDHTGLYTRVYDGSVRNYGLFARAWLNSGMTTTDNIGAYGECNFGSDQATNSYGVKGYSSGLPVSKGFGVHGYVYTTPSDSDHTVLLAGVYGSIQHPNYANRWAAYFVGEGFHSAAVWQSSDGALKQNVNDLDDASSILAQLNPKTYEFRTGDYPQLGLPSGAQRGLLAEELQTVLPDLVKSVTHPAEYDSLGNMVSSSVSFKAVNYGGLVPILVGASNEHTSQLDDLQTQVAALQQQLASMQQDLATCCEERSMMPGTDAGRGDGQSIGENELRASDATDQRLTITPNPFSEGTVIGYTLPKPGMVSLQVSDATGKSLFNLFEGQQTEGMQRYDWNTSFLAPGMYHVTLLVEGAPIIKKAVKVAR